MGLSAGGIAKGSREEHALLLVYVKRKPALSSVMKTPSHIPQGGEGGLSTSTPETHSHIPQGRRPLPLGGEGRAGTVPSPRSICVYVYVYVYHV